MKPVSIALVFMLIGLYRLSAAQVVSKDSITALQTQNQELRQAQRINKLRIELSNLQNQLHEQILRSRQSQQDARESAAQNAIIAESFASEPESKKLARRARKSARRAARDVRTSARADKKLSRIRRLIESRQDELDRLHQPTGK